MEKNTVNTIIYYMSSNLGKWMISKALWIIYTNATVRSAVIWGTHCWLAVTLGELISFLSTSCVHTRVESHWVMCPAVVRLPRLQDSLHTFCLTHGRGQPPPWDLADSSLVGAVLNSSCCLSVLCGVHCPIPGDCWVPFLLFDHWLAILSWNVRTSVCCHWPLCEQPQPL